MKKRECGLRLRLHSYTLTLSCSYFPYSIPHTVKKNSASQNGDGKFTECFNIKHFL